MKKINLNNNWKVTWTDGVHGIRIKEDFYRYPAENDPGRYLDINLPFDMNEYLMETGIIEDIYSGNGHLSARWVSEQIWQFSKQFEIDDIHGEVVYWLVFERLDYRAHIYVNQHLVTIHENAYIPCRVNITEYLRQGKNDLVVGLESGIYHTAEKEGKRYQDMIAGSITKSQWLRKPLYQFGWDWNPILINVGITGNVSLEMCETNMIDQVSVFHELNDDLSRAVVYVKACFRSNAVSRGTSIKLTIAGNEFVFPVKKINKDNTFTMECEMNTPDLWWPVGFGKQALYEAGISLYIEDEHIQTLKRRTGFRKIEIDRSPHPEKGEFFLLKVNHKPIFCKGANWVPSDLIYSKDQDQKIEKLVDNALQANFNILRIWGGGDYIPAKLAEMCDERGLLVWHDFLFACFKFPGDDPEFVQNIKNDMVWAARQLSHHPSIAVWCGNNEVQWIYEQAEKKSFKHATDYNIYHKIIPGILRDEKCTTPYWPGSPYSPGETDNNDPHIGDQHPWHFPLLGKPLELWRYRINEDRFPNEGGVLGVSPLQSLKDFIPEHQLKVRSFVWENHDNTCNYWDNNLGFCYRMIEEWLGLDYNKLSLEEYIFASSLIQGEGLMEYIMNYRGRKFSSASAIFWMYNDSWPATHSWSIVDYYLRRKPSFYGVKRSNNPVFAGLRQIPGGILVYAVNDTLDHQEIVLTTGMIDTKDLSNTIFEQKTFQLEPNSLLEVSKIGAEHFTDHTKSHRIPYVVAQNQEGAIISQSRMFLEKYKDFCFNKPEISIEKKADRVLLSSDQFVWAVCLDIEGNNVLDNFFDLIPGFKYSVPVKPGENKPEILYTGNDLVLGK